MSKIKLAYATPSEWTETVLADFDRFLLDHAAAEKKASGMAVSMLSHYPDRVELVEAMADLAVEEMSHYREVVKVIHSRNKITAKDDKDPYVNEFRKALRKGSDDYFLDRLLIGGIIEARGAERFGLIAEALEPGQLKKFYTSITRSEQRHEGLMVDLALLYFEQAEVLNRLQELIDIEAGIVAALPLRAALH
ncbi:MAG: tRNA-(ms[2]io[6]A)-hydroxylase [Oceanicoccus sp.]|uniref:tRNA-(ms[2]io[6]A)-hydroxylase n=1 Tax=Oceanicoccus sp. TaxID=2691044 RepID=UPI0026181679|nr:tRNA-(ms[2]io[6]A)-hydroxylase [Oceanicoccus sp.]MCP3908283.1 tRNA-(ms[2]io[6]A)-hydroxylase [Oceanicoccus sp.]MDG1772521.1 tRNA-(ms[2]io[6]A)-hydroxylase [Oceanicoccus sp.]